MTYRLHPTYMVMRSNWINQSDDPNQPLIPEWSVPLEYRTPNIKETYLANRTSFFDRNHQLDNLQEQSALERHIQIEEERNQTMFQNPYLLYRIPNINNFLTITTLFFLLGNLLFTPLPFLFPELFFYNTNFRMFGISTKNFPFVNTKSFPPFSSRFAFSLSLWIVSLLGFFLSLIIFLFKKNENNNSSNNNTGLINRLRKFVNKYKSWYIRVFTIYIISLTILMLIMSIFYLSCGIFTFVILLWNFILWSLSLRIREKLLITYYTTNSF
ncbi:hypothetical protein ABK040_014224 [Willaertia magna]